MLGIPAVAENGDINAPPAPRRSLSGTHFAREGSAARLEMAGVAAPPGRTARRLAGSLRLPCAVGAESHGFVRPCASLTAAARAPQRNIMSRIA